MNESLLKFAYIQYAADIPHDSIIQSMINKGASPAEAQNLLDIATIVFCTKSGQTAPEPQPTQDDDMSFGGVVKFIIGIISLIVSLVQCMN